MLILDIAVAKVPKYAVRESGDSVEIVERPRGGLSVVMVDGQRSGRSAKAISNVAVRKALSLLAEGVRDGAVARATHDYLRTERSGQVSAELTMISLDLETSTVVVTRNSQCPVLIAAVAAGQPPVWRALDEPTAAVGVRGHSRPVIAEWPLTSGQTLVAFTDGMLHAGTRRGPALDVAATLEKLSCKLEGPAQALADALLSAALAADEDRPTDDITVVVVRIAEEPVSEGPEVRRMTVTFPVG